MDELEELKVPPTAPPLLARLHPGLSPATVWLAFRPQPDYGWLYKAVKVCNDCATPMLNATDIEIPAPKRRETEPLPQNIAKFETRFNPEGIDFLEKNKGPDQPPPPPLPPPPMVPSTPLVAFMPPV